MDNPAGLLFSLQHSDSFFPSGAASFSWGLETLYRDKIVTDANSLTHFLETQLLHRWITFDQSVVSEAWCITTQCPADSTRNVFNEIINLDVIQEAMTLSPSTRSGSRRMGQSLIKVHAKIGTQSAIRLQNYIASEASAHLPHLAVAQGYLWASLGISEIESRAISAHTLITGTASAAIRLGIIGHIEAQRIIMQMQILITDALSQSTTPIESLASGTLAIDVASLKHTQLDARMFIN
jgi:urease accessory protein